MVKHLTNTHESLGQHLFLQPRKTKANPRYHILPENLSAHFCSYNESLKLTSFPILSHPPLLSPAWKLGHSFKLATLGLFMECAAVWATLAIFLFLPSTLPSNFPGVSLWA